MSASKTSGPRPSLSQSPEAAAGKDIMRVASQEGAEAQAGEKRALETPGDGAGQSYPEAHDSADTEPKMKKARVEDGPTRKDEDEDDSVGHEKQGESQGRKQAKAKTTNGTANHDHLESQTNGHESHTSGSDTQEGSLVADDAREPETAPTATSPPPAPNTATAPAADEPSDGGLPEDPPPPDAALGGEEHLKHPEKWVTGGDAATSKQKAFVAVLEKKKGEAPDSVTGGEGLTKAKASERINELKHK